ncbi:MAG: carbohydrate ABC transporter permease, partial [Anaerolineales bacterium]|nr:carbohydrate ABC transporter permease [Anaerolineales bacterium]
MKVARGELWAGRTLLLVLMAFTILPFISIFMTALHPSGTVPSGFEWPANPQWINFVTAWNQAEMPKLIASSLFIVLAVVPAALVISTMAGYAIGLLKIPGARVLLFLFVFGLTLPFAGIIIPIYFLERAMGIYNTRLAIVLPLIALYMPFAVFWMRAHFVNMPPEISEAARVDGATAWDLFWQIHVPLARPPISSLGILMAIWTWNQFLLCLVLVEDPT